MPFLADNKIEEIFLDSEFDYIYINHQKWGRCRTNYQLCVKEINAIKTHLRIESKKRIDFDQPSLIHVINNQYFHCRFSIDIYPSHWKNFAFDIRKMNKNVFTIFDLIENCTLNYDMAAIIIICLILKINITIVGEVDSGKTTLMNALDLLVPIEFRKIYVEETVETLEIPFDCGHQLKYVVEPEINSLSSSKEKEIYKLLHRSGDFIILGEILSKNETNALFHCLSAGLKGMQTTHASNLNGLINRWLIHYGVKKSCINDLGIIILMKKIDKRRIIINLSELFFDEIEDLIDIRDFYNYIPQKNDWIKNFEIINSKWYKEQNKFLNFTQKNFFNINQILVDFLKNYSNLNRSLYNPLSEIYIKIYNILLIKINLEI
jgi:flagellar protein FlaI